MSVIDYKDTGMSKTSEDRIIKRIDELSDSVKANSALMTELMEKLEQINGSPKLRAE